LRIPGRSFGDPSIKWELGLTGGEYIFY